MITITATINLLKGGLNNVSTNALKTNVSRPISAIMEVKTQSKNPFIIGVSKIGDGSTMESSVDYFISKQISDSNGIFDNPLEIEIKGSNISSFIIDFDNTNGKHPNYIEVDGQKFYDDNSSFEISVQNKNEHTIIIDNWNTPNSPLVITSITTTLQYEINNKNLIDISRTIYDRSDLKLPSYGVISNIGNIEFNDYNGKILDLATKLILIEGLNVDINITNTLNGKSQQIGSFNTEQWDYNNESKVVKVSLKDDLEEWQNINIEGFSYDPRTLKPKSLEEYYRWLYERTPIKYKMIEFEKLDTDTQTKLSKSFVAYPLLENGTLWQQWNKLCQVAQARVYKTNNGSTTFVCSEGN